MHLNFHEGNFLLCSGTFAHNDSIAKFPAYKAMTAVRMLALAHLQSDRGVG